VLGKGINSKGKNARMQYMLLDIRDGREESTRGEFLEESGGRGRFDEKVMAVLCLHLSL